MKLLKMAASWLFILCLPMVLLTASISWAVNSAWLYEYGFAKYGVSQTTGLAQTELDKAATGLVRYFNNGDEDISITVTKDGKPFVLFNEREAAHLRDVKGLIWLGYRVLLGTLIYSLGYACLSLFLWKDRRRLARGLAGGSALTLVIIVALGAAILFDFDQFFLTFHLISFANDLWILDPTTDYLIMLFPQGFWFDASLFCAVAAAAGAVILGVVGVVGVRKNQAA